TMDERLYPDGARSLGHPVAVLRRLILGGWLLVVVLSGCAPGVQDHQSHTARDMTDAERALARARDMHDRVGEAHALQTLGNDYRAIGQAPTAEAYLTQALAIWRTEGDRTREGQTLHDLGFVAEVRSQYDPAQHFFEQALTVAREVGDPWGEGNALHS